jgi:hypothetical protein
MTGSEHEQGDGETVGYGRPPKATRFQPGKSGNPKGRPKGSRNVRSEVIDLLVGKVAINDGGRRRYVTRLEAVILTQWHRAVKGSARDTQALIAFAKEFGLFEKSEPSEPSRWWSDDMLEQLSDEELQQVVRLDEKRRTLLSNCAPPATRRIC